MSSVRSEDPIITNDRPLEGPASALAATQPRVCRSDITVAGSPGPKLPLHATSENADNCLPAPGCIRATLFGNVDDPQFAPFRGHILTRIIRPSRAWLCSMAQVEPLEATGS